LRWAALRGPPAAFAAHSESGVQGPRATARRGVPVRDALEGAMTALTAAGVDTPRLDAEVLLAYAMGIDRARLYMDRELTVEGSAVRAYQDAVRRRSVEREPVAYITGKKGFRHIELNVDHRALIPRPETELLVEIGIALPEAIRVLDVGTGSGALALALKHERKDLTVTGSDISEQALILARENGAKLGLEVDWLRSDLLDEIPDEYDAVLSNPPYVAESERRTLAPEILRHEPEDALFAGDDGLETIGSLIAQLAQRERIRTAALEVGAGQADPVSEMMRAAGFPEVRTERDLAGIERVIVAERRLSV
jgi:release factor glutamine methyltransferase